MKTTSDLKELMAAVERMRSDLHPEISFGFIQDVVAIEHRFSEDDKGALAALRTRVAIEVDSLGQSATGE